MNKIPSKLKIVFGFFFFLSLILWVGWSMSDKTLIKKNKELIVKEAKDSQLEDGSEMWKDGSRVDPGDNSFEWWYFDGTLEDGTIFVISWNITRNNPYLSVNLNWPDGTTYTNTYPVPQADFDVAKDKCYVKIGKNVLQGDLANYSIKIDLDDLKINLLLKRDSPSWKDFKRPFGEATEGRYTGWFAAVPKGKITGNIEYKGEKREVAGLGYHDHNWFNMSNQEYLDRSGFRYWGRVFFEDGVVIFAKNVPDGKIEDNAVDLLFVAIKRETVVDKARLYSIKDGNIISQSNLEAEVHFKEENWEYNPVVSQEIPKEIQVKYSDKSKNKEFFLKIDTEKEVLTHLLAESKDKKSFYSRVTGSAEIVITSNEGVKKNYKGESLWEISDYGGLKDIITKSK